MPSEKVICPNCHKKIPREDNFCSYCGKKIHKKIKLHKNIEISLSPKNITLLASGIILIIVIILWLAGLVPICGDMICSAKECSTGCADCNPDKCKDNICQPLISENCDNSDDCGCDVHETCAIGRINTNDKECYVMTCSDGYCDNKKEDTTNCCLDCGCVSGYTCNIEKNECQFGPPRLVISNFSIVDELSASTLYSNKYLINDEGESVPFLNFSIENIGANIAKNIIVKIKLGYFTEEESINFENLEQNQYDIIEWYPTAKANMLSIKETKEYLITVTFNFEDERGEKYESTETIPVEILGRNNWDYKYSSWAQFVTPQDKIIRDAVSSAGSFSTQSSEGIIYAAGEMWDFLGNLDIGYISDPNKEYVQYPAEVLNTKKGDCDDLAILYATMLESVGIESAVIEIPGHLFAAYYDETHIYPVETTMIGDSFEDAGNYAIDEYNYHEDDRFVVNIQQEWEYKNINTPASVGISNLDFPNIDVDIATSGQWKYDNEWDYWELKINCEINFVNTGNAEGNKCITVYIYKDGNIVKTENVCETIAANDNEEIRVRYSENSYDTYEFNYNCKYI